MHAEIGVVPIIHNISCHFANFAEEKVSQHGGDLKKKKKKLKGKWSKI
jgi:hypothetical protein